MVKLFLIAAAILAIAHAVPVEKRRVPVYELFKRRGPISEPKLQDDTVLPQRISLLNITQRVDNFNPRNFDTWEQRYYVNDYYYTPGSPIFLCLAGEWEISDYRLTNSLMHDMANGMNARILYLEHRYYGQSRPTPNVTDENLRFLTPEQAMADTAHFINHIRTTEPDAANSPFILVGGHYSASLCVWFRQRYPHLSIGVWASSAPLESIVDFDQFNVATGLAYRTVGGDSCYDNLELGFDRIQDAYNDGRFEYLTDTFYLCDPLEPEDLSLLMSILAEMYAFFPQFEYESYLESTCLNIEDGEASIESIAYILNNFIDVVGGECIDIDHDALIEADRQTDWEAPAVAFGLRQWTYMLCTQVGWFHSSGSPDQPFGNAFPIDVYMDTCELVFGDSFDEDALQENSQRFNTIYGGLTPRLSDAIFTHGQHDPWNVIGIRTDLSDDAIAIVIEGATMGKDLEPRSPDDTPAVRDAKNQIEARIHEWINATRSV